MMSRGARAAVALLTTALVFGLQAGVFIALVALGAYVYFSEVRQSASASAAPAPRVVHDSGPREIAVHGNVGSSRRVIAREAIALGEPPFIRQPVAAWMAKLHCSDMHGVSVELAVQAACYHATAAAERTTHGLVITERDFLSTLVFAWESEATVQMMAILARCNEIRLPCAVIYADSPAEECAAVVRERARETGEDMNIPRFGEIERCHEILMAFYERHDIPVVRISTCISYKDALTTATQEALESSPRLTEACVWEIATACKVQGVLDPT